MNAEFSFPPPHAYEEDAPVISATPFSWRDPASLPRRPWLYGRHLLRRQVSVTVAAGGVGKSSLTIAEALAMASGRSLLGDWIARDLRVWVWNLEDPRDELDRRFIGAMLHHGIAQDDIKGRLFVDSGRDQELVTAVHGPGGAEICAPIMDRLAHEIIARGVDVLIVDPFISSHRVNENDNGAIDLVAKAWAGLADRCNCAIELVHHTRKANGEDMTSEGARGATALLAAARSGRVLARMSEAEKADAGVTGDPGTFFSIARDKANLAPPGAREWRRVAGVPLGNGDTVGVVEEWHWPDTFAGMSSDDLLRVQRAIQTRCDAGNPPRFSDQSGHQWGGAIVADVLGLDPTDDRKRIKKMIAVWMRSGALAKGETLDTKRMKRPTLEVGKWATD